MNSRQSDKELVRLILRGDVKAFSGLVRDYSPRMLNLALGIVRRRDIAEDVVQDALVKAYEKLGSWRGSSSLATWFYRIVYTTAVSSLRGRHNFFEIPEAGPAPNSAIDDDDDRELTEENIARMRRALETLSPEYRTVVNLFYIEDCSVREISAICGISEANVKTRLHRARARLRELINRM